MRATSYDPMIILNGSDRETAEVVEFFKDFVKEKKELGWRFTKDNIKEVVTSIKDVGDGDKVAVSFIKRDKEEKYDFIQIDFGKLGKFDWDSDEGFELEGYIAKHCDCSTMEKVGECDCEVG